MSGKVVPIDRRASARAVAAEVRRRYVAERSERELLAIQRNRFARLRSTKRWWTVVCATAMAVGAIGGAVAANWWQGQSHRLIAKDVPVNTEQIKTQTPPVIGNPATATLSVTPAPNQQRIAVQVETSIRDNAPLSSATGLPPGKPVFKAEVKRQVVPSTEGSAKSINSKNTKPAKTPSTQYEARLPVEIKQVNTQSPIVLGVAPPAVPISTSASGFQIVGVPIDGVLQIQVGRDPAIKQIRVGEKLPTGEVLRKANYETGVVETSEKSFATKPATR